MQSIKFRHVPTNQVFLVTPPAGDQPGSVRGDLDGDGKIGQNDTIEHESQGVDPQDLLTAADAFQDLYARAAPGTRFPPAEGPGVQFYGQDKLLSLGGRLNQSGQKGDLEYLGLLNQKQKAAIAHGEGLSVERSAIAQHLDPLDFKLKGTLNVKENFDAWRALGFSRGPALVKTVGSAAFFGSKHPLKLGTIDIESIDKKRPSKRTGIFDQKGQVNQTLMDQYLFAFEAHSKDGEISQGECKNIVDHNSQLNQISSAQWGSFFEQCEKLNGRKTVTSEQFKALFTGELPYIVMSKADSQGRRSLDRYLP